MKRIYIMLVTLAAIFSIVLLFGCGGHSSPSVSVQGNVQESETTGTVEGRTWWYTDTDPNQSLLGGVHFTFSSGGQTYSTDSEKGGWGWYSIALPSSAAPGIRYTIRATAENCEPYEGEVTVVTGTSIKKDITMKLMR